MSDNPVYVNRQHLAPWGVVRKQAIHPQIVSSVVVDSAGTVIAYAARPDDLADGEFWACTYRAVVKAACAIQERDSVIPESGVLISPVPGNGVPYEGWDEEDIERAQRFVIVKLPGGRIIEADSNGDTKIVELSSEESPSCSE